MSARLGKALTILIASLLGGCGGPVPKQYRPLGKIAEFSNADWQKVLDRVCTEEGLVRYEVLTYNEEGTTDALFRYVGLINAVSPENRPDLFPTDQDKLAYYLNAYNALCMYGVLRKGLPENVLASGVYFFYSFPVGGVSMSLDKLEKTRIRTLGDPRVHFALNCMSRSCPPLRCEAYDATRLDQQLDDQARRYLSDPRGVQRDGSEVKLSEIFRFYQAEFIEAARQRTGREDVGLLEAIEVYAAPDSPVHGASGFTFMKYDWSLNRAK